MNANPVRRRRHSAVAVALLLGLASAGCDSLLDVTNPRYIAEEKLTDPGLEQLVVNGVIGEFQYAFGYYSLYSSAFSGEGYIDHTTVGIREITLRNLLDSNLEMAAIYSNLHRARQSAEDGLVRLKTMLGDANYAKSVNVATVQAYGGYAYVFLAEGFCDSPVNLSAPLTPDQLFQKALTLFDQAIATATAAGSSAAATDIINMARVGAARAALKMGDNTKAVTYASQVPASYEKWAWYSLNSTREYNIFNVPAGITGAWLSEMPNFRAYADLRIPATTSTTIKGLNANPIYPPQKPIMYSGWTSGLANDRIKEDTDIKFATGLEAQYVIAEANGPVASTLTFVNARRAVGGQAAVNLTGNELMAELRVQRSIDFYLTGQYLGDLRRYKAKLGIDLFPSGKFPVTADVYSSATCFMVPISEKNSNPYYK
jgi:hypothetical protein